MTDRINTFTLQNKFNVAKFMTYVSLDFIYSVSDKRYLLLNQSMFGEVSREVVDSQIDNGMKVVVIDNDTMKMQTHNIDEEEVIYAIMKLGE